MDDAAAEPLWFVRPPTEWPNPPASMSFSDLRNIESCPRRWSLSSALYPDIWDRRGYPPKLHTATLYGQVLHVALDSIVQALNTAVCNSIDDEQFVAVMRNLGGYSRVIEEALDAVLKRLNKNPRFMSGSRHFTAEVKRLTPSLRENLQVLVSKLRLGSPHPRTIVAGDHLRAPLKNGTYAEIEVKVPGIQWHGFIDLLTLSDSACEIVDFKSGLPAQEHEEQLKIYSLLWTRDAELNPQSRAADSLTLSYSNREVVFKPLTNHELNLLEQELMRRTSEAIAAIRERPPLAVPSLNNCRFCSVRQLCDQYWTRTTQMRLAQDSQKELTESAPLTDMEVEITQRESPSVWRAIAVLSQQLSPDSPVLIQVPDDNQSGKATIQQGRKLRLIDALLVDQDEDKASIPLISLGKYSEVFVV